MTTIRVWFTKTGEASYISLLDLQRVMQRALKRSGLPGWSTLGCNPHSYMTFAAPLSLGQDAYDLLETVGRKRGMLMSGGVVNTERAAITLVDEFRGAKLGRVSLERPEEA